LIFLNYNEVKRWWTFNNYFDTIVVESRDNMDNYKGETFLNRLYKDLHMSDEVMHTASVSDNKNEKVRKYLDRLEHIEDLAVNSKYNGLELLKEMYYKKYIIKRNDVPESYFELQKKIALERGFGHIEISNNERNQMIDTIIEEQKKSLDTWLDYLLSKDSMYPEWFKYYAFQGMVKLGAYDKSTSSFNKRTNSTTSIFVDLNREALALVYDNLNNALDGIVIDDKILQKLIEGGSFSKLYAYMLKKLDNSNKHIGDSNDGIWINYNQGSKPDQLVKSLEGKGTGWCTAGLETARSQLQLGDFYVYYTKDSNGEYKQPRIAIRMEGNKIGEIRGISEHQNLETEMEEVLDKKLEEFPDKDKYKKKVRDMEMLTIIYKEYKDRDLTAQELRFLYEIDSKVDGFGYSKDPRIEEILKNRDFKEDLSKVFNCSKDEISNDKNDVLNGKKIVCFYGDLNLNELISAEDLILPNSISGSLSLGRLRNAEGLTLPNSIGRRLDLSGLESAKGLTFPDMIGENLYLSELTSAEGLKLPNHIGDSLFLSGLTSAKGLVLPNSIGGDLILSGLTSAEDLVLPNSIGGGLYLNRLTSAKGLVLPNSIGGVLILSGLKSAEGLTFPDNVGGGLYLSDLTSAKGLVLPNSIGEVLDLGGLTNAEDLVLPNSVGGSLYLDSLKSAKGLTFPYNIGGSLYLRELISAEDLTLPNSIDGDLDLRALTNAKDLVLPNSVGGNLYLSSLKSAESLTFPDNVGRGLYLSGLTSAEGLILPTTIGGNLYLDVLTDAEGLILPNNINGALILRCLTSANGLTLPISISSILDLSQLTKIDGIIVPQGFRCGGLYSNHFTYEELIQKSLENDIERGK